MKKFMIYWWIRGVGGPGKQGQDIIETEIDYFDEVEAEDMIQKDLDAQLPKRISGSAKHFGTFRAKAEDENYKPFFPNFIIAHKDIMMTKSVSNWGIRKIVEVQKK